MLHHVVRPGAARRRACAAAFVLALGHVARADCAAQPLPLVREPRIDVTVDGGVAVSTRWFRDETGNGTPGAGPTFGAGLEIPVTPDAAVRLRVSYAAQHLEYPVVSPSAGFSTIILHTVRVRGLAYDVSVVARPFGVMAPDALRGVWLAAGVGAATTWFGSDLPLPDGEDTTLIACRTEFADEGVCIPRRAATRAQATAGVGADLVPLGRDVSLFASLELHVHRPPVSRVPSPDATPDDGGNVVPPARFGATPGAIRAPGVPGQMVAKISRVAASGRATAGVRITLRRAAPPGIRPPPPPPPAPPPPPTAGDVTTAAPPSPTTGGYVEVTTPAPGASVYLIPYALWRNGRTPRESLLCRPNAYFLGTTVANEAISGTIARAETRFLVVVQGGRYAERRIQVTNGRTVRHTVTVPANAPLLRCR